jgi:hypothetical protein
MLRCLGPKATIYKINVDSILYRGPAMDEDGWRCVRTTGRRPQGRRQLLAHADAEPEAVAPWRDLDEEAALTHVMGGREPWGHFRWS